MSDFIAKTDENWASFLKEEGITDNANFWSPHPSPLLKDLPGSHIFFFSRVPAHFKREVVGWGKVVSYSEESVARCWELFGSGNGANSMAEMLERMNEFVRKGKRVEPTSTIGVNVIDDILWLETPVDLDDLKITVTSNTVRGRSLTAGEVTAIMGHHSDGASGDTLRSKLDLLNRQYAKAPPSRRLVISHQIERDPVITKTLKSLHNLNCQYCGGEFFFKRGRRTRYSEVHHIRELYKGGLNSTDNCLVLCANCHRRMHYGDLQLEDLGDKIRVVEIESERMIMKNIMS